MQIINLSITKVSLFLLVIGTFLLFFDVFGMFDKWLFFYKFVLKDVIFFCCVFEHSRLFQSFSFNSYYGWQKNLKQSHFFSSLSPSERVSFHCIWFFRILSKFHLKIFKRIQIDVCHGFKSIKIFVAKVIVCLLSLKSLEYHNLKKESLRFWMKLNFFLIAKNLELRD